MKQTVILLQEQINDAKINNNQWHKKFGSEFSLGYIMGFSTILIKSKTNSDEDTAISTKKVFDTLFGKRDGMRVMATAKMYSEKEEFKNGLEKARIDLIEFINNNGEKPQSFFRFLKDK